MNTLILTASVIFSFAGVAADNLTTLQFINDIGIEYEWNPCFKKVYKRYGYKAWMPIEALIIISVGIIDSVLPDILFCGIFYGIFRSLAATHNFQIIGCYQTIGIDALKKHSEYLKKLFQKTPNKMWKMKLQFFTCSIICFFVSFLILFVAAFRSLSQVNVFWNFFAAGLVLGVASFLFMKGKIT